MKVGSAWNRVPEVTALPPWRLLQNVSKLARVPCLQWWSNICGRYVHMICSSHINDRTEIRNHFRTFCPWQRMRIKIKLQVTSRGVVRTFL